MFIKLKRLVVLLGLMLGLGLTGWSEEVTASPAPTDVPTEKLAISNIRWDEVGKREPIHPKGDITTNADFISKSFNIDQPRLVNKIPFFVLEEGQTELEVPLSGARVYIASTAAFRAYENDIDVVPLEYSGKGTQEGIRIWVVFFAENKRPYYWEFKLQHYGFQSKHFLTGPGLKQEMTVIMRYPNDSWLYDTPFITYMLGASPVD